MVVCGFLHHLIFEPDISAAISPMPLDNFEIDVNSQPRPIRERRERP
jgi:hypothetical protein